ncbi:16S rRNA (cytosine(1402)-N(4))-methyltransferase RsmH [Candidatus Uhrbacteria bacterium]|nr:16S rRNA (cytosine(1402)-N(4))-methyltransferase RsmH [Candidatus Uhrbacteria bacterium]
MILHKSVLLQEAIFYLDVKPNHNYIDATLGGGGHTEAMLEQNGPRGKVVAFELDDRTMRNTRAKLARFSSRLIIMRQNFRNIAMISRLRIPFSGILYDLGLSTDLIKKSGRGFSFLQNEPLDMRFSVSQRLDARQIVNSYSQTDLAKVIREYGEERFALSIARHICETRKRKPILTSGDLVEVIEKAVPGRYRHGRIHCATRTFQALRIVVNDELEGLKKSLLSAVDILGPDSRVVVISFHSLEDRIVKHYFRQLKIEGRAEILTKKPITASKEECEKNPNARSAKLRAIQCLPSIKT